MSLLFRYVLDSSGQKLSEFALGGVFLLGAFVVYIGAATATALFHRDVSHRLVALEVLRTLVSIVTRRVR